MSFIVRRGLSTLVPPKIASPSLIGKAKDAARMERLGTFYGRLPRGPAPYWEPKTLWEKYEARYFYTDSIMPVWHLIGILMVLGYSQHYYFHFRHQKKNAH